LDSLGQQLSNEDLEKLRKELSQQKEEEKEKAGRATSIMYGNKQSTVHPCSHGDRH